MSSRVVKGKGIRLSVICVAQLSFKMKYMLTSAALATSCVVLEENLRIRLLHGLHTE